MSISYEQVGSRRRWRLAEQHFSTLVANTVASSLEAGERKHMKLALRQAEAKAEAANQAQIQFLANVSYEIRTPMNGVLGMAELLLKRPLGDKE